MPPLAPPLPPAGPSPYTRPGRSSLPPPALDRPLHGRAAGASPRREARRPQTPAPSRLHALPRSRPPGVPAAHWPQTTCAACGDFVPANSTRRASPRALREAASGGPGRRGSGPGRAGGERSAKPRGERWRKALRTGHLAVLGGGGLRTVTVQSCIQPGLGAVGILFFFFLTKTVFNIGIHINRIRAPEAVFPAFPFRPACGPACLFFPGLRSGASLKEPESKGRKGRKDQSPALFRRVSVGLQRSSPAAR